MNISSALPPAGNTPAAENQGTAATVNHPASSVTFDGINDDVLTELQEAEHRLKSLVVSVPENVAAQGLLQIQSQGLLTSVLAGMQGELVRATTDAGKEALKRVETRA